MKKLGAIILNWNGVRLLKEFLPEAARQTIGADCDLIVADNGSTDGSVEWVRANCPDVKLVCLDKNYGFAEGYNIAIDRCEYPFITLLNSDVLVTPDWWRPVLRFMEENPTVGAVQPKILSYKERNKFEYAGAAGGYLDALGYPYCRGRLFDCVEEDKGQYDGAPVDVTWASGACLTVRRDVYRKLGGLDSAFFAHMEEIDLCCRMIGAGYRVCAISDSAVYHVGGASLNQGNPQKTYLNFRNNLLLLHKNLPAKKGRRKIFLRRLADTLAFGMFIMKGDIPNARAVLRAHSDFRKMRGRYTERPDRDYLSALPGSDKYAVWQRQALRRKRIDVG